MRWWSSEEDAALIKLWQEGKTAAEIGEALGRPRNSVIGRAHRLRQVTGDAPKPSMKSNARIPNPRRKKESKIKEVPVVPEPAPKPEVYLVYSEEVSLANNLLALRHNQCRWPLGVNFCEETRKEGRSYCAHHCKIAYQPLYAGVRR